MHGKFKVMHPTALKGCVEAHALRFRVRKPKPKDGDSTESDPVTTLTIGADLAAKAEFVPGTTVSVLSNGAIAWIKAGAGGYALRQIGKDDSVRLETTIPAALFGLSPGEILHVEDASARPDDTECPGIAFEFPASGDDSPGVDPDVAHSPDMLEV